MSFCFCFLCFFFFVFLIFFFTAPSVPMLSLKHVSQPFLGHVDKKKVMAFARWDSTLLAETLTLCGHELFRSMPPYEMCGTGAARPVLDKQISLFSQLSNLVVWSITNAVFPLALLKKFIKLTHIFFRMNNLNYVAAIVTGLNSGHVQALKQVWIDLPESSRVLFDKYDALVSPIRNFSGYRAHLATLSHDQPCYPYLAVLTRDLLHISEGNPTMRNNGSINYTKISLLGNFIEEWRLFQTRSYDCVWNPKVAAWVGALDQVPDLSNVLLEADVDNSSNNSTNNSSGNSSAAASGELPHSQSSSPAPSFLRRVSTQVKGLLNPRSVSSSPPSVGRKTSGGNSTGLTSPTSSSPSPVPQQQQQQASEDEALAEASSNVRDRKSPMHERPPPLPPRVKKGSQRGEMTRSDSAGSAKSELSEEEGETQEAAEYRQVRNFLVQKGLQRYEANFERHSIRPSQLRDINDYDLISMGIVDKSDRNKVVTALRGLAAGSSSSTDLDSSDSKHDGDVEDSDGGDIVDDSLAVKVSMDGVTKMIGVNNKSTIAQVENAIAKMYKIPAGSFVVKLMDLEGDLITLKTAIDLEYSLLNYKTGKVLFYVAKKEK